MKPNSLTRLICRSFALVAFLAGCSAAVAQVGPDVPFTVHILYPTNGESYLAPASIDLNAVAADSVTVRTVEYLSGTNILGIVTNRLLFPSGAFYFSWSGVAAGSYVLTAVATDATGKMATSAPVNITVTNIPLTITITSPTDGEVVGAPDVGLYARATGSLPVDAVEYFAGTNLIGVVTNSEVIFPILPITPILPPIPTPIALYHYLLWSNAAPGDYTLTAVAIDHGGNTATSAPVNITVTNIPLTVSIVSPTNGSAFITPADINLYSVAYGSLPPKSVEYFAGTTSLGVVTNGPLVFSFGPLLPPGPFIPVDESFYLLWSNVMTGNYTLTAVVTDTGGNVATSAPVNVIVTKALLTVSLTNPTNTETFTAPAAINLTATAAPATDIKMVQFFAGATNIGTLTNGLIVVLDPPGPELQGYYAFRWTNVGPGDYTLKAVATDSAGATVISAPVNIVVQAPTNPPSLTIIGPKSGETFLAPTNIQIAAAFSYLNPLPSVTPTNVEFFANGSALGNGVLGLSSGFGGVVYLTWTNPPPGNYALTAVGTGYGGIMATSAPVTISVVSTLPPVVTIYAPDPVAIEGTPGGLPPIPPFTNVFNGTNDATFVVQRSGGTNTVLPVFYSIGGTASNGVDYVLIPNSVTIPAGQASAVISIMPRSETNTHSGLYKTVILQLTPSLTASPLPAYAVGSPSVAEAIILEDILPVAQPGLHLLGGTSVHVSAPGINGQHYCVQTSTDLANWVNVCTNIAANGSVQYIDPNGASGATQFYRVVPVSGAASY